MGFGDWLCNWNWGNIKTSWGDTILDVCVSDPVEQTTKECIASNKDVPLEPTKYPTTLAEVYQKAGLTEDEIACVDPKKITTTSALTKCLENSLPIKAWYSLSQYKASILGELTDARYLLQPDVTTGPLPFGFGENECRLAAHIGEVSAIVPKVVGLIETAEAGANAVLDRTTSLAMLKSWFEATSKAINAWDELDKYDDPNNKGQKLTGGIAIDRQWVADSASYYDTVKAQAEGDRTKNDSEFLTRYDQTVSNIKEYDRPKKQFI